MNNEELDFVSVPIPRRLVTAVYRFVAEQEAELAPSDHATRDSLSEAEQREAEWDDALIRRNWQESPPTIRAFLRVLAKRPDELVPITELARAVYPADADRAKLAGVLGAFGRRCSSRYDVRTWPFWREWNYETSMWEYAMDARIAEMILRLFGPA